MENRPQRVFKCNVMVVEKHFTRMRWSGTPGQANISAPTVMRKNEAVVVKTIEYNLWATCRHNKGDLLFKQVTFRFLILRVEVYW